MQACSSAAARRLPAARPGAAGNRPAWEQWSRQRLRRAVIDGGNRPDVCRAFRLGRSALSGRRTGRGEPWSTTVSLVVFAVNSSGLEPGGGVVEVKPAGAVAGFFGAAGV